jgi:hypothetical protein
MTPNQIKAAIKLADSEIKAWERFKRDLWEQMLNKPCAASVWIQKSKGKWQLKKASGDTALKAVQNLNNKCGSKYASGVDAAFSGLDLRHLRVKDKNIKKLKQYDNQSSSTME